VSKKPAQAGFFVADIRPAHRSRRPRPHSWSSAGTGAAAEVSPGPAAHQPCRVRTI